MVVCVEREKERERADEKEALPRGNVWFYVVKLNMTKEHKQSRSKRKS